MGICDNVHLAFYYSLVFESNCLVVIPAVPTPGAK